MALLGFLSNLSRLFLSDRSGDASVAEDEGGAEVGVGHDQQVLWSHRRGGGGKRRRRGLKTELFYTCSI